jgi:hypothetical protein
VSAELGDKAVLFLLGESPDGMVPDLESRTSFALPATLDSVVELSAGGVIFSGREGLFSVAPLDRRPGA